mgnify:CR=1 FL=1
MSGIAATHGLKRGLHALNVEQDIENRLQAFVLKDRIRIKEFFLDFDRLWKGHVGEAGVS